MGAHSKLVTQRPRAGTLHKFWQRLAPNMPPAAKFVAGFSKAYTHVVSQRIFRLRWITCNWCRHVDCSTSDITTFQPGQALYCCLQRDSLLSCLCSPKFLQPACIVGGGSNLYSRNP